MACLARFHSDLIMKKLSLANLGRVCNVVGWDKMVWGAKRHWEGQGRAITRVSFSRFWVTEEGKDN